MKGFKEAYYKRLKKDFDINKEDSAIFLYNMREYEDNPRIIAAFCCGRFKKKLEESAEYEDRQNSKTSEDSETSEIREIRIEAALTFKREVVAILKNDKVLAGKFKDYAIVREMMSDNEVCGAGGDNSMSAGVDGDMSADGKTEDVDDQVDKLVELADEINRWAYTGEKKNYIRLRLLQLQYDYWEIDIPEFIEGYIRLKLDTPKINIEKDKGIESITDARSDIRVHNRKAIREAFTRLENMLIPTDHGKMKIKDRWKAILDVADNTPELFERAVWESFEDGSVTPLSADYFDEDLPCVKCCRPGIVQAITFEMLIAILWFDIASQFYDMGFRQVRGDDAAWQIDRDSEQVGLAPRKKDKSLDLMDMLFFRSDLDNPFSIIPQSDVSDMVNDEDYADDSQRLLDVLNDQKRENVCIPLRIDRTTGSGVYILGRKYYQDEDRDTMKKKGEYSRFGIVQPNYGMAPTSIFEVREIYGWEQNEYQTMVDIWKNEVLDDSMEDIISYNGQAPEGCPDSFIKWFIDDEEARQLNGFAENMYTPDIGDSVSEKEREDMTRMQTADKISGTKQGMNERCAKFRW